MGGIPEDHPESYHRYMLDNFFKHIDIANARFFGGDINAVPKQALTVGVGTVMDAREVMVLITGANKSIALYKAVEEGVCHMWTVSAFQMHNNTLMVCDEDATLELRVRTVKYFKDMWNVHASLNEEISEEEMRKLSLGAQRS